MYKHLHFLIVPTSEHLNFTVNNGFAFGGECQVSHPTGGGRHSHSHCKLRWREPTCRQPSGSGEEPFQGKVPPGRVGVHLQGFAPGMFLAMLITKLCAPQGCDTIQPLK